MGGGSEECYGKTHSSLKEETGSGSPTALQKDPLDDDRYFWKQDKDNFSFCKLICIFVSPTSNVSLL